MSKPEKKMSPTLAPTPAPVPATPAPQPARANSLMVQDLAPTFLYLDKAEGGFASLLPAKSISASRFVASAKAELLNIYKAKPWIIKKMNLDSLEKSMRECAQRGFLLGGGALARAYLIPYENKKNNDYDMTLQFDYKAYIDMAWRAGWMVEGGISLPGETFDEKVVAGRKTFEHVVDRDIRMKNKNADPIAAYVTWVLVSNPAIIRHHVIYADTVERAKAKSGSWKAEQAARAKKESWINESTWTTHKSAMWIKTAIRDSFKYIPGITDDMAAIVEIDDRDYDYDDAPRPARPVSARPRGLDAAMEAMGAGGVTGPSQADTPVPHNMQVGPICPAHPQDAMAQGANPDDPTRIIWTCKTAGCDHKEIW